MLKEASVEVIKENLMLAEKRLISALELCMFDAAEIAECFDFSGELEGLDMPFIAPENRVCSENAVNVSVLSASASALAYCLERFCKKFRTQNKEKADRLLSVSSLLCEDGVAENSRIAYLPSAPSDEAYRAFSEVVENASVIYPSSFAAVCEEVYYGRAGYCILPYESSDEGILTGFMKMIAKYEFSPIAVCSVKSQSQTTKFALLGRSPYAAMLDRDFGKRFLKVTFDTPDSHTLCKLTVASFALECPIVKTDSVPVPWDEGRYRTVLTFDMGKTDASPMLLYLKLALPECSEKTVYTEI